MLDHNVETPENKHPKLSCNRCKTVTPHSFSHKEKALADEEDKTQNLIFTCDECLEPRRYGQEAR